MKLGTLFCFNCFVGVPLRIFEFFRLKNKYDLSIFLIAFYLLLIPFGRLSVVPMAIMSISGVWLLFKKRYLIKTTEIKYFSLLFATFWLPVLFSLPDAVNIGKTTKVGIVFFCYWLAGLFIIHCLRLDISRHKQLLRLCAFIIFFWVADVIFQALVGYDVFGYRSQPGALNGLFGAEHPKMGIYLAALSPFLLVCVVRYRSLFIWALTILATSSVVFLAGRRGGWIMLAVVLVCLVCWFVWSEKRISLRSVIVVFSLIFVCLVSAYFISPAVAHRVGKTLLAFHGDLKSIDDASSFRLPIWGVAFEIIKDHPVNGVGARGFRYAYRDYAKTGDRFIKKADSLGAYYPHQLLLDIGSGTGFIGLVGFMIACWLLISRWLMFSFSEKQIVLPYALALLAVFFPLNTHYATYSSHWSSLFFWLLALYSSMRVETSSEGNYSRRLEPRLADESLTCSEIEK